VEDDVDAVGGRRERVAVADVPLDDGRGVGAVRPVAAAEVIEDADVVVGHERVGDVAPDEPRTTCYEHSLVTERRHRPSSYRKGG